MVVVSSLDSMIQLNESTVETIAQHPDSRQPAEKAATELASPRVFATLVRGNVSHKRGFGMETCLRKERWGLVNSLGS